MSKQRISRLIAIIMLALFAMPSVVLAGLVSGSTGADGAFSPTVSVAKQLPESGVFNFTTVYIPYGVTVTFLKNSRNTPVTILATGDVTISGNVNVDGSNYISGSPLTPGVGGPGGFAGGAGGGMYGAGYRGQGPGGGKGGDYGGATGSGGGFASVGLGTGGGSAYGNDTQIPMVGGSGGGGSGGTSSSTGYSGGGGGGAILIASSGTITLNNNSRVSADGGVPYTYYWNGYSYYAGGGSGGSIRLVATTISGDGTVSAVGGLSSHGSGAPGGGTGRIRLEAWNLLRTAQTTPAFTFLANPSAVVPATLPTLMISSVGGVVVPAVPKGDTKVPDIQLPANTTNPVTIVVSASAIPVDTTVTVKSVSAIGGTVKTASATLSGTDASSTTASVSLDLPVAAYPSIITVSATYTAVAANGMPLYVEGERIDKVRVETAMGGASTVIYITESGREIPAKS